MVFGREAFSTSPTLCYRQGSFCQISVGGVSIASAATRAYSGGLGIAPSSVQRQRPSSGGQGALPPEVKSLSVFRHIKEGVNLPIYRYF